MLPSVFLMASIKISNYTRLHKLTILPANGRLKAVQTKYI